MVEKRLSPDQRHALKDILGSFQQIESAVYFTPESLQEQYALNPQEAVEICGVIGLTMSKVANHSDCSDNGIIVERGVIRKFAGMIINNPPGSRNVADTETGFEHSVPGYSRRGRNHANRAKAVKR